MNYGTEAVDNLPSPPWAKDQSLGNRTWMGKQAVKNVKIV